MIKKRIFLLILTISIVGCKKFLDITPSNRTVNPVSLKDFQEILNSDSLSTVHYFFLDLMSDDVAMSNGHYNKGDNFIRRLYIWDQNIWNEGQDDIIYNSSYARILQMNVILTRIKDVPKDDSNAAEYNYIVSQALIQRAYYYLQLVNTYGNAYDSANAQNDLAVPLVLNPDANTLNARATVQQIYDQILSDLKSGLQNTQLPNKGADIIHTSKSAGYGLLSRTYLYMGDYDNAMRYADSTLKLKSDLRDQNKETYRPNMLLDLNSNPEILLGRISLDFYYYSLLNGTFNIGPSLLDSLGGTNSKDRRYIDQFSSKTYKFNPNNIIIIPTDNSITVAEVMLISAECLARQGKVNDAANLLTKLRNNRMPSDLAVRQNYTTENILNYVLGERRRELCFHGGLRLFDLKRLNKDSRFKTDIVRKNDALTTVVATLTSNNPRYLLPFSSVVLNANSKIIQNPR